MSVVKLFYSGGSYGNWELLPGRLLCVDNIETYLTRKTYLTLSSVQFQQLKLEMSIKLDLSQHYSAPRTNISFKYISIQNTDESVHYYFVKSVFWRSVSCVEFDLVMDVLNTFKEGTDYNFKPSTNIIREHKDRFKHGRVTAQFDSDGIVDHSGALTNGTDIYWAPSPFELSDENFHGTLESHGETGFMMTFEADWNQKDFELWLHEHPDAVITDGTNWNYYKNPRLTDIDFNWYRLIDYVPEGINPTLQAGSGEGSKIQEIHDALNQTWHLLYRNVNDPSDSEASNLSNPVECYLIPDNLTDVRKTSITSGTIRYSSLMLGKVYRIPFTHSSATDIIVLDDGTEIGSGMLRVGDSGGDICIYRNQNNRIVVLVVVGYTGTMGDECTRTISYECEYFSSTHLPLAYRRANLPTMPNNFVDWATLSPYTDGSWSSGNTDDILDNIDKLDRTDPKNIKLIKLPYCPHDFAITGGKINLTSEPDWSFAEIEQDNGNCRCLKLNSLNVRLVRNFTTYYGENGLWDLRVREGHYAIMNASKTDLRLDSDLESKMYASEFFQPTYYYDSFTFKFELERCDIDYYIDENDTFESMPFAFECTSTINSRFMFTFTNYELKMASSNYAKVMPIIRNNEEVLYNVPYVNYIRTGFNYDVKSKNLQIASNLGSLALSGGSMLASLLLPSIPLKVAGIIGSIASFANSAKNAIVSAQSAENSIEAKLKQAENQKASVQGADDVDLMTSYTENRLKFLEYVPNPIVSDMLKNLFFYAGYRSGRMGMPNHVTRINFDYLECVPQFENIRSIPSDCLQELANCFKSGVTYLHTNAELEGYYDFEQSHENWERFLFD